MRNDIKAVVDSFNSFNCFGNHSLMNVKIDWI